MTVTAAEVLKDTRLKAGLTQSDLSKRARITQSFISAYESGRRDPSLSTLNKLVSAAGFALDIGLTQKTEAAPNQRAVLGQRREELISPLRSSVPPISASVEVLPAGR